MKRRLLFALIVMALGSCGKLSISEEEITLNKVRGQLLIDAIEMYRIAEGKPPAQLQDLVPTYLQAVPTTTMGPEFTYRVIENDYILNFGEGNGCIYSSDGFNWSCVGF